MAFFLIRYHRPTARLLECREFAARDAAYAERRRAETDKPADVEVVVLEAASLDDARRTHSRYFKTLAELAQ